MKNLLQQPSRLAFCTNPTFSAFMLGFILIFTPATATKAAQPTSRPPAPKPTVKGQYNLKNGQVISGTIRAITSLGVLIKIKGAKTHSRIPLYYMYPGELTRDSTSMNSYLTKANDDSPAFCQGFCLFHGYGKQPNIPQALKYFEHAATEDRYLPAAYYLQWIYQSGDGGVNPNALLAGKWKLVANNITTNKRNQVAATRKALNQQLAASSKPPTSSKTPTASTGTRTAPSLEGIGLISGFM